MCLCQGIKSVSHPLPPHPPSPPPVPPTPPHLPPHPPTPKIITRSFVDNVVKRFNHLATCQASCNVPTISCNVTTYSTCAIFDELQEKIRSIASRPAQKVPGTRENSEHSVKTGSKSDWKKFRAELATSQHLLNVPSLTSYKRKLGA